MPIDTLNEEERAGLVMLILSHIQPELKGIGIITPDIKLYKT